MYVYITQYYVILAGNEFAVYILYYCGIVLIEDTSINRTLSSVSKAILVYLTTSEIRTPYYSGHFNLSQMSNLG